MFSPSPTVLTGWATADGGAFADEAGRADALLGGDQVERAALVVGAPAAPVAAAVEQRLERLDAEALRWMRSRVRPPGECRTR